MAKRLERHSIMEGCVMTKKDTDVSRREFLSRTSVGLASVGLGGIATGKAHAATAPKPEGQVIYRTLAKTGIRVPIVSMGVMNANNPELIPRSYEIGVRLFDTAMGYQGGRNEEMVGSGIQKMGIRDDVIIVTKIPNPARARRDEPAPNMTDEEVKNKFLENAAGCLKRLKTDYVDVLLFHNVTSAEDVHNPGVMEALTQLKKEGKAKFIGVSTHKGQDVVLNEIAGMDFYDVITVAVNFTMADNTALFEAIDRAHSKGIGLIAMKTQGGGRNRKDLGPINETAAMKYILRNEKFTTAIPGYTNFDHMEQDFSVAYGLDLTPEEKSWLSDKKIQMAAGFCQQCDTCAGTCPNGVDIPALMRTHMYAAQYANFHQARETLEEIPEKMGLGACSGCTECNAHCANSVDIPHAIGELKTMYA
jgi:predicted aldo/keto reductase-like oxidoreductase